MKFYIVLFALTQCINLNAAQVAKVLTPEQENDARFMFQLIHDKCNDDLEKFLQKYPEIVNAMPEVKIKHARGYSHFPQNHCSMLSYASKENNHEALCLLLEYNANPDIQSGQHKYTALMWAAHFCDLNCVKTLISAGADKEFKNENQKTAIDAAKTGDASVTSSRSYYEEAMKRYHQAIADGEAERDRYAQEKPIALQEITDVMNLMNMKDLAAIVCGYAYGVLPRDLPKACEEKKEKRSWLQSHCAIQ